MRAPRSLIKISETPTGRTLGSLATMAVVLLTYMWTNHAFEPKYDYLLPLDEAIPFLPWTLVPYFSLFLLVPVVGYLLPPPNFVRLVYAVFTLCGVSTLCFWLFTSHYPRPDPQMITSDFWRPVYVWLQTTDQAGNTLPSLHVSMSWIIGRRLTILRKSWGWLAWFVVIILSTLTTKQHFVLDVVTAIPLAMVVHAIFYQDVDREAGA